MGYMEYQWNINGISWECHEVRCFIGIHWGIGELTLSHMSETFSLDTMIS